MLVVNSWILKKPTSYFKGENHVIAKFFKGAKLKY